MCALFSTIHDSSILDFLDLIDIVIRLKNVNKYREASVDLSGFQLRSLYVSILCVIIYNIWLFIGPSTHYFNFIKFKFLYFIATCFGINIQSSGHFQMFANN
jgi:hypothetical protein